MPSRANRLELRTDRAAFRRQLLRWFAGHGRDLPWRHRRDPYAILVSEFMLQQTQVATVIPYYTKWLRRFPDFASVARASQNDVLHAWQGLGYYNRARNLRATAKIVRNRHRGNLPGDVVAIRGLPGVGRYIANAVATFAFNQSVPIVEANSSRVLARLLDVRAPIDSAVGREKLWEYAAQLVPKRNAARFNSALIDLGALVCLPAKPKCNVCPVKTFCRAKNPEALPIKKSKLRTKRLIETHAFVVSNGRVLLEQSSARWSGMWILPRLQAQAFGRPLYRSTFPFTHHRIAFVVYRRATPNRITPTQQWFASIDHIAMPSPHRRAAQALLSAKQAARPRRRTARRESPK
ncbi:MAG TPA: A/G-specific adenine glycosylase [Candidatus Udaeobacter sp.]|nr:A/G-specific adenine glycosylase [Candidatus Udaeobacter sp.]